MATRNKHGVRKERTYKRDLSLNNRHRQYGYDCPAVDLDLFLEYDAGEPAALIEYKYIRARPVNLGNRTIHALETLATRAGIPSFLVHYHKDPWRFWVMPMNDRGHAVVPVTSPKLLTERQFVDLLYHLRGRTVPFDVAADLDDEILGDEYEPAYRGHLAPEMKR